MNQQQIDTLHKLRAISRQMHGAWGRPPNDSGTLRVLAELVEFGYAETHTDAEGPWFRISNAGVEWLRDFERGMH